MNPSKGVLLCWYIAVGLAAHRSLKQQHDATTAYMTANPKGAQPSTFLPAPAGMVSTTVVYSILAVVANFAPPLATALSVGFLIALAWSPGILPGTESPPPRTLPLPGSTNPAAPGVWGTTVPGISGNPFAPALPYGPLLVPPVGLAMP